MHFNPSTVKFALAPKVNTTNTGTISILSTLPDIKRRECSSCLTFPSAKTFGYEFMKIEHLASTRDKTVGAQETNPLSFLAAYNILHVRASYPSEYAPKVTMKTGDDSVTKQKMPQRRTFPKRAISRLLPSYCLVPR